MINTALLGDVSLKKFLQQYWQKKPLLIRQAIPDMSALLSREALFALAGRDDVESRLITNFRQQWKMQHGPVARLPKPEQKNWTLLIQGVNLHDDQASKLLNQFRFIPDSRLDDLMISYASDGGGVGAHFDSYDVFLLQAHGKRRWRISSQEDLTLQAGMPLKILQNFIPESEFTLEPGDMLYLPPHVAHEGVAVGECMTYSIGFRAPAWQELGESFLEFMADSIDLPGHYNDAGQLSEQPPAKINDFMLKAVSAELAKLATTPDDVAVFLGQYLSEPKSSVFFDPPQPTLSQTKFDAAIKKYGLRLSRKTRMLYRSRYIFINGLSFQPGSTDKKILISLADEKTLDPARIKLASTDLAESFYAWYCDGWIAVNERENLSSGKSSE